MDNKKDKLDTSKIAGRTFEKDDYNREDETSSGLATTHEQANDNYAEGTIDGKIEKENGEIIDIPRKGNS
ncbi:YozQ family protein [Heyndrickxia acidicola]|uniref:YozQ family protein n=1 Tax=Heyndrickxia acidicola TaxID=209389 RepID=A0ABU6MCL0_9BACI|nr:YozQ family protein [Heyndrickxia acidicola]MED1202405.1 YozQ family protein [Heyndrickxia acidicola]